MRLDLWGRLLGGLFFVFNYLEAGLLVVSGFRVYLRVVVADCCASGFWLTRCSWAAALG